MTHYDEKVPSLGVFILILGGMMLVGTLMFLFLSVPGREFLNNWHYKLVETDVNTKYENQQEIENTLRSYVASYKADAITYETNKMADSEESQALARAAKTRANRTAAVYNEYYLKNSHVWEGNIPEDIEAELPYLE